jgi:DNA-binding NarL/FixJ family response regulator
MVKEAADHNGSAKMSPCPVRVVTAAVMPHARKILASDPGLTFVQFSGNTEEALKVAQGLAPCVFILSEEGAADLKPGSMAALLEMNVHTLVLLRDPDDPKTIELIRIGHSGVLGLFSKKRVLRKAIRAVASGEIWAGRRLLSDLVRDNVLSHGSNVLPHDPRKMTPRETEILALIAKGCTNREIADRLFVTRETVRWHQRRLYSKLGIRDRDALLSQPRKAGAEAETDVKSAFRRFNEIQ